MIAISVWPRELVTRGEAHAVQHVVAVSKAPDERKSSGRVPYCTSAKKVGPITAVSVQYAHARGRYRYISLRRGPPALRAPWGVRIDGPIRRAYTVSLAAIRYSDGRAIQYIVPFMSCLRLGIYST